jgi:ABC-2 type transport system permease protein
MREALGLLRAGWVTALSYRMNLVFSLVGLFVGIVPLYFVAQALQPVAASSIQREGGHYFGFVIVGLAVFALMSTTMMALPNAVSGAISSGVLEAILATPARLPGVLLGLIGYELSWSAMRAGLMLVIGAMLGSGMTLSGIPVALAALLLVLTCYFGLGMGLAGMILVFRTMGPLGSGLLVGSALLGGVYYSTTVIPSWIQDLSVVVPLTYGLRVIRQALLAATPVRALQPDLLVLLGMSVLLLAGGTALFQGGLRHARREGTLGQY